MGFVRTKSISCQAKKISGLFAMGLLLAGCGRSSFLNGQPLAPKNLTPSLKVSNVQISPYNVADGISAAEVTITLKNDQGDPIQGATTQLSVSGGDNVIVPCTASDANGISRCRVYSTRAEIKTFSFAGALLAAKDVEFLATRPQRAAFSFVGSASVQTLPGGQKIISSSGLVEGPITMKDSNGVVRVYTSLYGAILGN
jgi:Bacterial Ig-like domain (group 1)